MLTRGAGSTKVSWIGGGGGSGYLQYGILDILNFVGFFLVIVGQTFKIILVKNNCHL
jgi:hypothetical protein